MKLNQPTHGAALALLLALAACQGDDPTANLPQTGDPDAPVEFLVTRTTTGTGSEVETMFKNDTWIGICVQGYDEYSNAKYKYSDGKFVPAEPGQGIYFGKAQEEAMKQAEYTAYYPYSSSGIGYKYPTVQPGQSTEASYYASDALIATGKLGEEMKFTHRMAKVIITTSEAVTEVSVKQQPLRNGSVSPVDIPCLNAGDGRTWRAILVPGTRNLTVEVVRNGETYEADFGSQTLEAGKQYTFSVDQWRDEDGYLFIDLAKGNVNITQAGKYRIYQSTTGTLENRTITVNCGDGTNCQLVLDNLDFKGGTCFTLDNGTATVKLQGTNQLQSTGDACPGVRPGGSTLILTGDGSLTAIGGGHNGWGGSGPGIGNGNGHLIIRGTTVTAKAGDKWATAAGIGTSGGYDPFSNGDITIENATVTAEAGDYSAAIGTGYAEQYYEYSGRTTCGNITIKNSTLYLTSGEGAAAIGNGKNPTGNASNNTCGNITVEGCTITPSDARIGNNVEGNGTCGTVTVK